MKITKGLVVDDPWIGYLLDGSKTWEMRSSVPSFRGWFGLIRKGTGAVHGIARLADVGRPLSAEEMLASIDRHRIPAEMIRSGKVAKWNTPWIIADARRLPVPVPYRHPYGAVTWVNFDPEVVDAIAAQTGGPLPAGGRLGTGRAGEPAPSIEPATPVPVCAPASAPTGAPPMPVGGRLVGQVELTQGNIDNSHIYLRAFFDRFPQDAVGGSNRGERAPREVCVDWGGASPVSTDLDGAKRFFRARGWIGSFFEMNAAQAGDRVLIHETAPYAYSVRLDRQGGLRST